MVNSCLRQVAIDERDFGTGIPGELAEEKMVSQLVVSFWRNKFLLFCALNLSDLDETNNVAGRKMLLNIGEREGRRRKTEVRSQKPENTLRYSVFPPCSLWLN